MVLAAFSPLAVTTVQLLPSQDLFCQLSPPIPLEGPCRIGLLGLLSQFLLVLPVKVGLERGDENEASVAWLTQGLGQRHGCILPWCLFSHTLVIFPDDLTSSHLQPQITPQGTAFKTRDLSSSPSSATY